MHVFFHSYYDQKEQREYPLMYLRSSKPEKKQPKVHSPKRTNNNNISYTAPEISSVSTVEWSAWLY